MALTWFETEKKKIYDETTSEELEEIKASIEEQSKVITKAMADAEAEKNEYFKQGNLTKALEKDGIIREKEAALETLREYAESAGFKAPMTPAKYSAFRNEIRNYYSATEKSKYEAMLALMVKIAPIIEEINALELEKSNLDTYLEDIAGAYERDEIRRCGVTFAPDYVSTNIINGIKELTKSLTNKISLLG